MAEPGGGAEQRLREALDQLRTRGPHTEAELNAMFGPPETLTAEELRELEELDGEDEDWEPETDLTPEKAVDNFKQSIITSLQAGDPEEDILADIEAAFGMQPTPEQWAAFKARELGAKANKTT